VFVDVWKGLNVRLAISEGETAILSGQMSMRLHRRYQRILQAQTLAWISGFRFRLPHHLLRDFLGGHLL
jgi:hypothetical protein